MNIKYATTEDITAIAEVEAECFPPAEAATEEEFMERIRYYGNHFWLMYEAEKLIAFVDGFVTDEADLTDEMYEKAEMHNENGAWQMILGVNTCKEKLVSYYAKFGFLDEGVSEKSTHGNAEWHQMRLAFNNRKLQNK